MANLEAAIILAAICARFDLALAPGQVRILGTRRGRLVFYSGARLVARCASSASARITDRNRQGRVEEGTKDHWQWPCTKHTASTFLVSTFLQGERGSPCEHLDSSTLPSLHTNANMHLCIYGPRSSFLRAIFLSPARSPGVRHDLHGWSREPQAGGNEQTGVGRPGEGGGRSVPYFSRPGHSLGHERRRRNFGFLLRGGYLL